MSDGSDEDPGRNTRGYDSLAYLAAIVDSSDDAIISMTLDGIITSWNAGATKTYGYSAAEAMGKPMTILIPPDRLNEEGEILAKISRGENVKHFHTLRVCKDRRLISVSSTISPVSDSTGMVIGASKISRDISDQMRLQRQLAQSEAEFRGIFEQAAVGVAHVTLDGKFKLVNQRYADILEMSREQLQSCSFQEITHPDDLDIDVDLARQLVEGTISTYTLEKRYLNTRKKAVWVNLTGSIVRDNTGEPVHFVAIVEDIDERKEMEEKLRESELRFRTMANSIPQLAWIASADGSVNWYNDRWYEYTGTTFDSMQGWGWRDVFHPSEFPRVVAEWEAAVAAGKPLATETSIRGADGVFRTFLTRVEPVIDSDGKAYQWFGTNTDVDALKRAEDKIRAMNVELEERVAQRTLQLEAANVQLQQSRAEINSIFESLPGLYLVLTPDLTIVSVSDAYLEATLTTREGIVGRNLFDVFPDNPDDIDADGETNLLASLNRVRQNLIPDIMAIQKYDVRRPDGTFEERYWSPINSPVFGADRRIKYIVHRVEEVTEFVLQKSKSLDASNDLTGRLQQMEAEVFHSAQQLQATNQRLEAANRELEAFSYSVSHDLRAPLRGVDGYVRMIKEDFADRLDEEGNRMLDVVSNEARRMGRLIDDLLTFSRLSRQPLQRSSIDMTQLAQSVYDSVTVDVTAQPRLCLHAMPTVSGDIAMLRQVYVNLLGNAVKFSSHETEPTIEVGCTTRGGNTVYYVRDNGVGFDEKYSNKLFAVFQRLHSEEEFQGTGVGLALVQRIVHRHAGKVWAESKLGEGATFYFTIPD